MSSQLPYSYANFRNALLALQRNEDVDGLRPTFAVVDIYQFLGNLLEETSEEIRTVYLNKVRACSYEFDMALLLYIRTKPLKITTLSAVFDRMDQIGLLSRTMRDQYLKLKLTYQAS